MYTVAFGQNNYIEYYEAFQKQTEMGSEVWMIVLKEDVMNATTGNGVLCHELHKKMPNSISNWRKRTSTGTIESAIVKI